MRSYSGSINEIYYIYYIYLFIYLLESHLALQSSSLGYQVYPLSHLSSPRITIFTIALGLLWISLCRQHAFWNAIEHIVTVLSERFTPAAFRGMNASCSVTKREGLENPRKGLTLRKGWDANLFYRNVNFPKFKGTTGNKRAWNTDEESMKNSYKLVRNL